LKANPKEYVHSYSNVKTKEAAAGRMGDNEDSEEDEEDEEDDNPLYEEEEMSLDETPLKSEEAELKETSRPVNSTDGDLKLAASRRDLAAATYAIEQDGPTEEYNFVSKCLFPIDLAVAANNTLYPTNIVCKLMSVDEGWNDKTVIKQQIKTEWRRPLPYKCLYPRL
jgi:hypothetical protein